MIEYCRNTTYVSEGTQRAIVEICETMIQIHTFQRYDVTKQSP